MWLQIINCTNSNFLPCELVLTKVIVCYVLVQPVHFVPCELVLTWVIVCYVLVHPVPSTQIPVIMMTCIGNYYRIVLHLISVHTNSSQFLISLKSFAVEVTVTTILTCNRVREIISSFIVPFDDSNFD